MGPTRQNEKNSCNGEYSDDSEVIQLREKERLAERENVQFERRSWTGEEAALHQRDEIVRQYQHINDLQQENS